MSSDGKSDKLPPSGGSMSHGFRYNLRLFIVFLPAILSVLLFSGRTVAGLSLVTALVAYVLDVLELPMAAVGAVWVGVFTCVIALYAQGISLLQHAIANAFLLLTMGMFSCMVGLWITIQVRPLRESNPAIAFTIERVLFGALPTPAAVITTWAIVAFEGIENAPFYLLAIMWIAYLLLVRPIHSSFAGDTRTSGGAMDGARRILGRPESALLTLAFLVLPGAFYAAIHHRTLFTSMPNIANAMILFTLPFVLLRGMGKQVFWWIPGSETAIETLLNLATPLVAFVLLGALEYRVIFRGTLSRYIAVQAPYSYILVSCAVYGIAIFAFLHVRGLAKPLGRVPTMVLLNVAAVSAAFAQGVPLYMIPFVVLASMCLIFFYYERKLMHYLGFLAAATALVLWFMFHSFWFLDISFNTRIVVTWSLHGIVLLITFLFLLTLVIPGLAAANRFPVLTGALLTIHAGGLAAVEQILFDEMTYPPTLVIFTSCLGLYLVHRLTQENRISNTFRWLLSSIFAAKFALLLHPVAWAIPAAFGIIVTTSPQHYFMRQKTMPLNYALLLSVACGFATLFAKNNIIRRLIVLFIHETPDPSLLWAAFFLVWGFGCAPIALKYSAQMPLLRRLLMLVLSSGILFAVVQPPLHWDRVMSHVSATLAGDPEAAFFSRDLQGRGWPRWMLFLSGFFVLASVTSTLPLPRSEFARFVAGITTGFTLGLYVAGTFFPATGLILALGASIFVLLWIFVVFAHFPTAHSHKLMTSLFTVVIALLPGMWVALGFVIDTQLPGSLGKEILDASRMSLVAIYAAINIFVAIDMKFLITRVSNIGLSTSHHGSALASASAAAASSSSSSASSTSAVLKSYGAQLSSTAASHQQALRDPDLQWMSVIGNAGAILGFVLSVVLNIHYLNGSETCVFFLSPLLLLLNRDVYWFHSLSPQQRYFPLIFVTSLFLTISALWNTVLRHMFYQANLLPAILFSPGQVLPRFHFITALKGLAFLAITSATHYHMNVYFYSFKRQSDWIYILLVPLNVLPIIAGDFSSVKMLAVAGIVGGIVIFFVARSIHVHGQKFI